MQRKRRGREKMQRNVEETQKNRYGEHIEKGRKETVKKIKKENREENRKGERKMERKERKTE